VCIRDPHVELYRRLTHDKSNLLRRPDRNGSAFNVDFRACFLCSGFLRRENDSNCGEGFWLEAVLVIERRLAGVISGQSL